MDDSKYVEALKKIKQVKDENKQKVEKIRNVNLEEKKKIINCIVNIEIVERLIKEGTVFDPNRNGGELAWIYPNGERLSLIDSIKVLRSKLNQ
jgi:hypothetical protein